MGAQQIPVIQRTPAELLNYQQQSPHTGDPNLDVQL
jgi:hypothetical protein